MSWTTALAIYFVIWWVTLFVVLPFGVRSQAESGDISAGTDPGAPILPRMGRRLLWNTLVAACVFGVFYVIFGLGFVTLDDLGTLWGLLR